MATLIFTMLLYQFPEIVYSVKGEMRLNFIGVVFLMTFVIPLIPVLTLKKSGVIENLQVESQKERILPFIFTIIIYCLDTYVFYSTFKQDGFFVLIMILITFNMLVLSIINLWWKISIHAAGIGGVLAFYIVCSMLNALQFDLYLLLIILICSGLVLTARLELNSHTITQVIVGYAVGLCIGLSSLIYFNLL